MTTIVEGLPFAQAASAKSALRWEGYKLLAMQVGFYALPLLAAGSLSLAVYTYHLVDAPITYIFLFIACLFGIISCLLWQMAHRTFEERAASINQFQTSLKQCHEAIPL